MDKHSLSFSPPKPAAGFSLVEVAMAIGIVAFAFVALFSLLPTGLSTFRSAIDTANETWIIQNMNSMVQTTDFANIDKLDFRTSGEIYYFDEEAKATDTESKPGSPQVVRSRLYGVKLLTDQLKSPDPENENVSMEHGKRVIALFAPLQDPQAMVDFRKVEDANTLKILPRNSNLHIHTFVVARMDSQL